MELNKKEKNKSKVALYSLIAVLAAATLAFRLVNFSGQEQTSLLFVGIPSLITLLIVRFSGTPKTSYGIAFKAITLFLLLSSIVLGEGTVCIIMAAPIFYGVTALVVALTNYVKKNNNDKFYSIAVIPLLLLISQPLDYVGEPKVEIVKNAIVIDKVVSLESFNSHPDFMTAYPSFFKLGFPKPVSIQGKGIDVGDLREVKFKSSTKGIGVLTLRVTEKTATSITFDVPKDETHIHHWLTWQKIQVSLKPLNNGKTEVTWTSEYTCDLGPKWYFQPIEEYAVGLMNVHLINSYFK
jgi:hypothetical protein